MSETQRRPSPSNQRRLESFERRMSLPILLAALLPIAMSWSGTDSIVAGVVLVVTWVVFVVDYVVHWRWSPGYVRSGRGPFDLVVVVLTAPWFLVPGLGTTRFVALARLARLVRVIKAGGRTLVRLAHQLGRVGLVTGSLLVSCAYVTYSAERSVNEAYSSFGEALWWATVTITTVGYGDVVPVTTAGRVMGVVLMLAGLAVLGVLAGVLASFFGFGESDGPEPTAPGEAPDVEVEAPSTATVAELQARLAELERAIAAVRSQLR